MSETSTPIEPAASTPPERSVMHAVDRVGGYMLTFSIVFAAMVWASVLFLLPRFSTIEVLGARHTLAELPALKAELVSQVGEAEAKRSALVIPVQQESYEALKASQDAWHLQYIWNDVTRLISETSGKDQILHIAVQEFDPAARSITLSGDVRHSGTQSMTILAGFLDSLAKLPGVASLSPVPFTRLNDPHIGDYSPFTVTLTLE